jgi:hypothetical protein
MALILGGYAGGKTDAERIIELKAEAERVEAEKQKRVQAHMTESLLELEAKKNFNRRPEAPPVVQLAAGQIDLNSIRPNMPADEKEAARAAIERTLEKFHNR